MRCALALPLRVSFRLRVIHCEWRLAKSLAELDTTIVTGAVRVVEICRELGYGVQGAKVHLQFQFIKYYCRFCEYHCHYKYDNNENKKE